MTNVSVSFWISEGTTNPCILTEDVPETNKCKSVGPFLRIFLARYASVSTCIIKLPDYNSNSQNKNKK